MKLLYFSSLLLCLSPEGIKSSDNFKEQVPDYLLCRHCGTDTADLNYLFYKKSPFSLSAKNETLSGQTVIVQTLKNPLNIIYNVITLRKGSCIGLGVWQTKHSWFPGYSWKACFCQRCGQLLGWMFEPSNKADDQKSKVSDEGFYAVLIDNVLSEEFSNSLLVIPKSFQS